MARFMIKYLKSVNLNIYIYVHLPEPSPPQNIQVISVTYESIKIKWESPETDGGAKLKRYIVLYKETAGKKYKKAGKVAPDVTEFVITDNIEENKKYSVQVHVDDKII